MEGIYKIDNCQCPDEVFPYSRILTVTKEHRIVAEDHPNSLRMRDMLGESLTMRHGADQRLRCQILVASGEKLCYKSV